MVLPGNIIQLLILNRKQMLLSMNLLLSSKNLKIYFLASLSYSGTHGHHPVKRVQIALSINMPRLVGWKCSSLCSVAQGKGKEMEA